jgi:hypothetical protein
MQFHIQEVLPHIGRTFWIKRLVDEHIPKEQHIVIPDIRFKHEYDMLSQYNTTFWRVERPQKDCYNEQIDCHCSEKEYLNIPVEHVFVNGGTKEQLEQLIIEKVHDVINRNE